ncbi:hypothetical protein Sinac_2052 [Singulisphaera acidiphila DSM 18658]|uniref:Uncharacterized protein n=1 Tax=Singulisphaera acidiphila (strain ATCC BAA-1392 / DSM 18658 / VKM B-2454 / MOB10) TaxID=886293 RepID=L0DC45_SINAD|nr:hypothetical protein Sinac_2052 [Singulisphaera acidiphila DSM 18658]
MENDLQKYRPGRKPYKSPKLPISARWPCPRERSGSGRGCANHGAIAIVPGRIRPECNLAGAELEKGRNDEHRRSTQGQRV